MILVSENSTADNGTPVQSTVHLRIEDIGVIERPFFVKVDVGHATLFHSYEKTEAKAKATRERMHAAYLEVHSATTA